MPGLGQGSGPGMNADFKDFKYKELIETVTKKTEKVSKIEVYTRIVVLFFYPYIPLLLEQNISRYSDSNQLDLVYY